MGICQNSWLKPQWVAIPQDGSYFVKFKNLSPHERRQVVAFLSTGQYEFNYNVKEIEGLLLYLYVMKFENPDAVFLHSLSTIPEVSDVVNAGRSQGNVDARDLLAEVWGPLPNLEPEKIIEAKTSINAALSNFSINCHGVYRTGKFDEVVFLVKLNSSSPQEFLSSNICLEAQKQLKKFDKDMEAWEVEKKKEQTKADKSKKWLEENAPEVAEISQHMRIGSDTPKADASMPKLHLRPLIQKLPMVLMTETNLDDLSPNQELALLEELDSIGLERPRDGIYECMTSVLNGNESKSFVVWVQNEDQRPSYPEVRAFIQTGMPHSLKQPRFNETVPPQTLTSSITLNNLANLTNELEGFPSDENYKNRIESAKSRIQKEGIEALAWYSPWHSFSEETWGIYFDAQKLDDHGLLLHSELKKHQCATQFANAMAFGSVYAHELFHAKVEAALSWIEINSLEPRHIPYKKAVYKVLLCSENCLEEALANWSAHQWIKNYVNGLDVDENEKSRMIAVHSNLLNLEPPGYRHWGKGDDPLNHRIFSTQLLTGKPQVESLKKPIPANSILAEPFPYDLLISDIPLTFIGSGQISKVIESHPSVINTIKLKEFRNALRYFGFVLQKGSRGKGSHEFWTNRNNQGFTLPGRDPSSIGVFKSFLNLIGLTKQEYYVKVRPNIKT